ncbi:MAG: hypothetical protein K2P98_04605 [Neisseriaceae bacterium]|nr:hypothetical protein [Neisseriaceae bacterium]
MSISSTSPPCDALTLDSAQPANRLTSLLSMKADLLNANELAEYARQELNRFGEQIKTCFAQHGLSERRSLSLSALPDGQLVLLNKERHLENVEAMFADNLDCQTQYATVEILFSLLQQAVEPEQNIEDCPFCISLTQGGPIAYFEKRKIPR